MSEREREDLIAEIARSIVSRQGHPYSTQAGFVLEAIDVMGWKLVRKDVP